MSPPPSAQITTVSQGFLYILLVTCTYQDSSAFCFLHLIYFGNLSVSMHARRDALYLKPNIEEILHLLSTVPTQEQGLPHRLLHKLAWRWLPPEGGGACGRRARCPHSGCSRSRAVSTRHQGRPVSPSACSGGAGSPRALWGHRLPRGEEQPAPGRRPSCPPASHPGRDRRLRPLLARPPQTR